MWPRWTRAGRSPPADLDRHPGDRHAEARRDRARGAQPVHNAGALCAKSQTSTYLSVIAPGQRLAFPDPFQSRACPGMSVMHVAPVRPGAGVPSAPLPDRLFGTGGPAPPHYSCHGAGSPFRCRSRCIPQVAASSPACRLDLAAAPRVRSNFLSQVIGTRRVATARTLSMPVWGFGAMIRRSGYRFFADGADRHKRWAREPPGSRPRSVTGIAKSRCGASYGCYGRRTPSRPFGSWLMPAVNQSASVPPVVAVPGSRPHRPGSANGLPVEVPRTWPVTWCA